MQQDGFKMPKSGEGWRHYKSDYESLYTIVGLANHLETGEPLVVYTNYGWSLVTLPALYVRPLSDFLAEVVTGSEQATGKKIRRPRFSFARDVGEDKSCPFLRTR